MNNYNGLSVVCAQRRSREIRNPQQRHPAPLTPVSGIGDRCALSAAVYSCDCELYFDLISARRKMPDLKQLRRPIDEAFVDIKLVPVTQDNH